ncbi:hypothetical protein COLO4_36298 [Corchorus olitorius]|uniref:Uncharacterized protein n=1 Tax=Corchorus olitorius TaxID=93759 RepID=A0A1R3GA12_9ROSI|nr:hypothetical protein COLO4_36298 [Corchorus olitorius]
MGEHPQLQFRRAKKFGVAFHARGNFNSIFDPISFQRVISYIQFFAEPSPSGIWASLFFPFQSVPTFLFPFLLANPVLLPLQRVD